MERARVLRADDREVFFDQDSIRAGDTWPDVLREEVDRADRVWLGWSKYAAQSDWVRREYTAALAKGDGHLRIDRLDDTPLPDDLKDIQAEPWPFGFPTARLLRTLKREVSPGPPPPSILLRPEFTVVPFMGRTEIIDDVRAWGASDHRFRVRLYTGPGGAGKTRLFIQICDHLRHDGWDAGFLHRETFAEVLNAEPSKMDALFTPVCRG